MKLTAILIPLGIWGAMGWALPNPEAGSSSDRAKNLARQFDLASSSDNIYYARLHSTDARSSANRLLNQCETLSTSTICSNLPDKVEYLIGIQASKLNTAADLSSRDTRFQGECAPIVSQFQVYVSDVVSTNTVLKQLVCQGEKLATVRTRIQTDLQKNVIAGQGVVDQYAARAICSAEQVAALQVAQTKLATENAATVLALANRITACAV